MEYDREINRRVSQFITHPSSHRCEIANHSLNRLTDVVFFMPLAYHLADLFRQGEIRQEGTLYHLPGRMSRPTRTACIFTRNDTTQPAIRQAIVAPLPRTAH